MTGHSKLRRRRFMGMAAAAGALAPALVRAQTVGAPSTGDWPNKPVRFICGYAAGGLTDLFARLAAEHLTTKYGKTFVVENKTGAGSIIAADMVAKAAP